MTVGESSVASLERRLVAVESKQDSQAAAAINLQLQLEELEDRGRRNNLRIRGLPEATGSEDLAASALAIF